MDTEKLVITARELKEIDHSLYYAQNCAHGTTGHNQLMLIAKMAKHLGFERRNDGQGDNLVVPPGVIVEDTLTTERGKAA